MSKRRKCDEAAECSNPQPLSHGIDEAMHRPIGVYLQRRKKTISKPTTTEDEEKALFVSQSMWEIKKKDNEMKEGLSKNKMLDSLLLKTEPLFDTNVLSMTN
ncbi:hypothetical protein ISN44_As04g007750 [Arabidopsis suecica]|uniref:Uncharacterized protein n=1 Tax=Arabidopsis suecica TaxID=45249 RepID=A0A8T2E8I4_ARASU|nr:hypothetical protein ISN44_As04g007750 [Arabidopsis suecica]